MSGGKGGKQSSKVELFPGQKELIDYVAGKGKTISQLPYAPYSGPDVAAFTPAQKAAMMSAARGAEAYGLIEPGSASEVVYGGIPQAQTFAGGVSGYSSFPLFSQAVAEIENTTPGYMDMYRQLYPVGEGQDLPYYYPSMQQRPDLYDEEGNYMGDVYTSDSQYPQYAYNPYQNFNLGFFG